MTLSDMSRTRIRTSGRVGTKAEVHVKSSSTSVSRNRLFLVLVWGTWLLGSTTVFAKQAQLPTLDLLAEQLDLLRTIKLHTEQIHKGRVVRLRIATEMLVECSEDPNRGPLHADMDIAKRKFYKVYSRAKGLIKKSGRTDHEIDRLFAIFDQISQGLGLNGPTYLYETQNTFDEMKPLIDDVLRMKIDQPLQKQLDDLVVDIGKLSGKGAGGDQFKSLSAAIPVCRRIRSLYDTFYKLSDEKVLYEKFLEIQGLNEEYIGWAKIEEEVSGGDRH